MTNNIQEERYTLASNESGVYRLEILNRIHKPYTEFLLKRAGLKSGMVVADIGCGTGNVSIVLAQQIGDTGSVVGVDTATVMLEQGRQNAEALGLIESGLTTLEEIEQIINQFKILAADKKTVFSVSGLTQIWARK